MENGREQSTTDSGLLYFTTVLDSLWKGLKKFFWLVLPLVIAGAGLMYGVTRLAYTPSYKAYTSFVVSAQGSDNSLANYYNITTAEQLQESFEAILESGTLKELVMDDLGLSEIPGTISVEIPEDTSVAIFTINVISSDAQTAYDILQSVIENYPQAASYIVGNIEFTVIDESGVPASAYNAPDYRSAMKRGAAGGACVFVLVLLVYALSRNTVRREEDLERRSSMECLGKVPKMKHKKRSGKKQQTILLDQREISGAMGECFRTIRTRVVKNCENLDAHSVLVTSTTEGEGKTTIAVNLALSLAKRGLKVVLVDADLRRPSVAGALGMGQPEKGLKDVLSGNAKISETLVACDGGLFVLPGTGSIQEPSRLLGSSRMDSVLHALTKAADYVVVDSPPCGMLSDAALLARKIDSIVMVVK